MKSTHSNNTFYALWISTQRLRTTRARICALQHRCAVLSVLKDVEEDPAAFCFYCRGSYLDHYIGVDKGRSNSKNAIWGRIRSVLGQLLEKPNSCVMTVMIKVENFIVFVLVQSLSEVGGEVGGILHSCVGNMRPCRSYAS